MLLQLTSLILPCSCPQTPSPVQWEMQEQFLQQHLSVLSKLQQPGESGWTTLPGHHPDRDGLA